MRIGAYIATLHMHIDYVAPKMLGWLSILPECWQSMQGCRTPETARRVLGMVTFLAVLMDDPKDGLWAHSLSESVVTCPHFHPQYSEEFF